MYVNKCVRKRIRISKFLKIAEVLIPLRIYTTMWRIQDEFKAGCSLSSRARIEFRKYQFWYNKTFRIKKIYMYVDSDLITYNAWQVDNKITSESSILDAHQSPYNQTLCTFSKYNCHTFSASLGYLNYMNDRRILCESRSRTRDECE